MRTIITSLALSAFTLVGAAQADETINGLLAQLSGPAANAPLAGVTYEPGVQTIPAVEYTGAVAAPQEGQVLDMSGADGSLRACYANGGMAKQGDDLLSRCTYAQPSGGAATAYNDYITPAGVDTGYDGTTNHMDPQLQDCMLRGGSFVQLTNNNYACAM